MSVYNLEGKSLFVFDIDNEFRMKINEIVHKNYFEFFILAVIVFSSILLALDDPLSAEQN